MKKLLLTLTATLLVSAAFACTNFIVGKAASTGGQTMITYAADSYGLFGFLRYQPAANHEPGSMRKVVDWDSNKQLCEIPEVAHTYSVIGNMNEHQVTIGETTYGGRLELMDSTGLIDYGSMIYIALERSRTAREALACMTDLVAKYGYASEGESFSIADPDEVWLLELIGKGPGNKGAVWVAVRIPDDCISGHANQPRITRLPVDAKGRWKRGKGNIAKVTDANGVEWMWTKDIIDVARQHGYFTGKDADFSFADAYAPVDLLAAYGCDGRVWSFFRHYSDDMDRYLPYIMHENTTDHLPIWIKPSHKLSAADLKACMRDQYEGTPLSIRDMRSAGIWHSKLRYGGLTFKLDSVEYCYPRPTATQQTGWSYVSEMYSDKPYGIYWFGVDDAATNVYIPFFSCATAIPDAYREGNGDLLTYSPTSAFWAFNTVANYAYTKYERMLPDIQFRQQQWEERFAEDIPQLERKTFEMSEADRAEYLTRYSNLQAEAVVADWKDLFTFLMVKFLDGVEKRQDENGAFLRTPEGFSQSPNRLKPSEEYLRSIADEIAH